MNVFAFICLFFHAMEGVQPDVRHVRGMEGIISAGELIYLPAAWSQPDM